MNPTILVAFLAAQLRRLPEPVRTGLYMGYALACLLVMGLDWLHVRPMLGSSWDDVLSALAMLAPLFGFTAAANVKRPKRPRLPSSDR